GWGICVSEKEEELPGKWVAKMGLRRRPRKKGYRKYGGGLTGAALLQDIAGPTGQEAGFNTRNAASGTAIAEGDVEGLWEEVKGENLGPFIAEEGMWYAREEGSRRVAAVAEKNYQKRERAGLGRVGTAGRRSVDVDMQDDNARYRRTNNARGLGGAGWGRKGTKIVQRIRKPWEGKRPAGGRRGYKRREIDRDGKKKKDHIISGKRIWNILMKTEVSVRLVRRRLEDQKKADIGGISKAVVGRGRARRRHTEVRSSYHFRVRTKVNSTTDGQTSTHLNNILFCPDISERSNQNLNNMARNFLLNSKIPPPLCPILTYGTRMAQCVHPGTSPIKITDSMESLCKNFGHEGNWSQMGD
ncbi:hypothetical protein BY996DRAFT_6536200, partial [Phakopsora pachyrhizi]